MASKKLSKCKLKGYGAAQVVAVLDALKNNGAQVESWVCKECLLFHIRKIPQWALDLSREERI